MVPRDCFVRSSALAIGLLLSSPVSDQAGAGDRSQPPSTRTPAIQAAPASVSAEVDAASPSAPATEDVTTVTPADDAYHFAAWADGQYDGLYTEWWYFNFHNAFTGVRGVFSYFVTDPDDNYGNAQARMVAVAYTPQGIVTADDPYTIFEFSASDQQADVRVGANAAYVQPNGSYHITGASLDGRLAWDLVYAKRHEPWFAADGMSVGSLEWEKMSWLVQMPRAWVTGTLTVDGVVNKISAPGYHDHNWGEWIPTDALWNWAQFSNPRLSIAVGVFIGKKIGLLALTLDGERTVFTPEQYSFVNTRWQWDDVNKLYYPRESRLTADNGSLRLEIKMRAWQTVPLRGDLPWPLRDLIVYEQTARFQGRVWKFNPPVEPETEGTWSVNALIGGLGFKEWTWKRF
jgi:hypothetical protein